MEPDNKSAITHRPFKFLCLALLVDLLTELTMTSLKYFQNLSICFEQGNCTRIQYRGADKSLARPGRKQTTAREDFEFHLSYL